MEILEDAIEMSKGMTGKARDVWTNTQRARDAVQDVAEAMIGHASRHKLAAGAVVGGLATAGSVYHHKVGQSSGANQQEG